MQSTERKDARKRRVVRQKIVEYYRKDGIDPPIFVFEGTLEQFLKQSEIEPYGKILNSCDNHEVIVAVQRRDNGRTVELVAKEIERTKVSISHIFEPGFQVLTAKK